jgi:glycosyltransferase involved in cell wall biosynthesis
MKILIVTGIYPPEIGGPAEYAKNLHDAWNNQNHQVKVRIFGKFQFLPWGIRHILFLFYILPAVVWSDYIVALDAFSAGVVTVASRLFSKKIVFRTGGDVVWELYTERTGDLVLLKDFYLTRADKLSMKEKTMFRLMKWALQNTSAIIWSTEWQRDIFMKPYGLENQKHFIIENFYGPHIPSHPPQAKNFVGTTRNLKWKNLNLLKKVFASESVVQSGASLDMEVLPHEKFLDKISNSYAVVLVSLGDISPNMILDAIRLGKPFIVTKETGIYERIKDIALFVDPKDPHDIEAKVLWLKKEENYSLQKQKVESFNFVHNWQEMAGEYIDIYKKL